MGPRILHSISLYPYNKTHRSRLLITSITIDTTIRNASHDLTVDYCNLIAQNPNMTSRAMTTSSGVSVSKRRPLVHQRQISYLALPPLLLPATLPTPPGNTSSQNYAHSTLSTTAYPPLEPTPPIPTHTAPPTTSILRPPPRPTGSLIAHLQQHQLQQQQQKRLLTTQTEMSEQIPEIITRTRAAASGIPGEQVEPRQTLPTEDMEPNPANSIPLPPNRQKLVEDIIALYSCQITVDRVARYAPGKPIYTVYGKATDDKLVSTTISSFTQTVCLPFRQST